MSRLPVDRALNAYLYAIREHAKDETLDRIEEALEPPNRWDAIREAPVWWVDEDDAWASFAQAARA